MINKENVLRPHTSSLKPMLTDVNKMARLEFCLNERGPNGLYNAMFDRVHVDEKWFFFDQGDGEVLLEARQNGSTSRDWAQEPHPQVHAPSCQWVSKMGCWSQQVVQWEARTLASGSPGGGAAQQQASTGRDSQVKIVELDKGGLWRLLI